MSRAARILLVSNTSFSLWKFRKHVIEEMVAQGHHVTCVAADGPEADAIRRTGATFVPVALSRSGMNPFVELRVISALRRLIDSLKPDLVISYTIKPNAYVPLLADRAGVPCLAVVTGLGYAFLKDSVAARLARLALATGLRFANSIWFLNRDDLDHVVGRSARLREKSTVVPGEGIDMDYFDDVPFPARDPGRFAFLMIARALRDKGVVEYCEAASLLRGRFPDVDFRFLGDVDTGNPASLSREEFASLCDLHGVEWLSPAVDVRPAIAAADACVLPSYREGVPTVLLEAASMRRPLVAADTPGCRDVVRDGVTGYLVEARSASTLAQAMEKLMTLDQSSLENMKEAARRDIRDRFAKEIIIEFYRDVIARSTGSNV